MTKTSTNTYYEVRIAFGVSKELISDENWEKDELSVLVEKLADTADQFFFDKKIKMGHWETCAGQLTGEPQSNWGHNLGDK